MYVVTTQTLERTDGLEALNKAIGAIKLSIEEAGGMFNIQLQVIYELQVYLLSVNQAQLTHDNI